MDPFLSLAPWHSKWEKLCLIMEGSLGFHSSSSVIASLEGPGMENSDGWSGSSGESDVSQPSSLIWRMDSPTSKCHSRMLFCIPEMCLLGGRKGLLSCLEDGSWVPDERSGWLGSSVPQLLSESRSCSLLRSQSQTVPHTPIFTVWSLRNYLLNVEHCKTFHSYTKKISGCL